MKICAEVGQHVFRNTTTTQAANFNDKVEIIKLFG